MLFSSIPFLYYFLPAVLIVYFLVPRVLKNTVLLLSSLVFYGWGEPKLLFLMLFTIALFYGCGLAIGKAQQKKWKKFWLIVSVVISVALLGLFKYADFFIDSFNAVTGLSVPMLRLALPVGISFYTFQCLSYTIDVYRGKIPAEKSFVNVALYIAFFPQLVAGPIVKAGEYIPQLYEDRNISLDNLQQGVQAFALGLFKKVVIADNFALLMKLFRESSQPSVLFYWMYAIAFTLNIYFDFSGYSDMAIGLGRVFGFRFIENFNYPYLSKSVAEFWRRWHMSLGSWFRDYIYIPLGGNRVSKGRWVFNTLVVWMLTGAWHGAAWNFILWGLLYAVCLMAEKWIPALQKLPTVLRRGYTLLIVVLGFVLFNAADLSQAGSDIAGMFGFGGLPLVSPETLYYLRSYALLFILGFVGATPLVRDTAAKLSQKKVGAVLEPIVLIILLLVCTGYLVDGSFSPFLYFRF